MKSARRGGLACWVQATESSRRVNFSAFGKSRLCEFAQGYQGCLQGRTPAAWVCSPPRSSEKVRGLLQSFSFPCTTQWFLQQVSLHRSHWDIFPHFQDYGHFYLDLCVLPAHTKTYLGTGLVGLKEIHICPVQAIGIQSFTLSNATKREKRSKELALHFSTFKRGTVLLIGVESRGINRFLPGLIEASVPRPLIWGNEIVRPSSKSQTSDFGGCRCAE